MRPLLKAYACTASLSLLAAMPATAREWHPWCGEPGSDRTLGWHFYCDPAELSQPAEPRERDAVPPPAGPSATAEIERMRQQLEETRAVAILEPTPENVAAYLYLQQDSLHRASTFSDVFRRVVWSTPELDYTLNIPITEAETIVQPYCVADDVHRKPMAVI